MAITCDHAAKVLKTSANSPLGPALVVAAQRAIVLGGRARTTAPEVRNGSNAVAVLKVLSRNHSWNRPWQVHCGRRRPGGSSLAPKRRIIKDLFCDFAVLASRPILTIGKGPWLRNRESDQRLKCLSFFSRHAMLPLKHCRGPTSHRVLRNRCFIT